MYLLQFVFSFIFTHIFSIPAAVVGLEDTSYHVSESAGVVEMCATVYDGLVKCPNCTVPCPVNFTFDVSLSASTPISAGIEHYSILPLEMYEQLALFVRSCLAFFFL